jgi:MoaA/NifB/PqqE/SkfB family radical SAM enzyme
VALYTNGSLIDAAMARELARLRLNKVDITLPGYSSRVFDRVTCSRGLRRRVFGAIDLLRARQVPLAFKSCVLAANEAELPRIAALARRMRAVYRMDDRLTARLDGSRAPMRFGPRPPAAPGALCACGIGSTQAAITPQGQLKPCVMLEHPRCDIRAGGIDRAWARLRREFALLSRKAAAAATDASAAMASPCLAERLLVKR